MNSDIMIGTWARGAGYNGAGMVFGSRTDPEILQKTFERAMALGLKKWDTAAVYGMGSCEKLLGKFMAGREDIFISTKFFPAKKYKAGELTKSFENSMARLGRSNADIFWIHTPHNITENLKEALPLMKDRRIRSVGISNVSMAHIRQAEKFLADNGQKLGAVQNHFSLLRNDQQPIIDYCAAPGIVYYAYRVLEQGALTGKYSAARHFPTFSMRNLAFPKSKFLKIEALLAKMQKIAEKYAIDPSQVPVLWVLARGAVPIVGITKPAHAEKLAAALDVTLTAEETDDLTEEAKKTGIRQQGSWEPQ